MAIRIELWTDEGLVGGAEQWWDDVESALPERDLAEQTYPILSRIDPYGDIVIGRVDMGALAAELDELALQARPSVRAFADQLAGLCRRGLSAAAAELRFLGD